MCFAADLEDCLGARTLHGRDLVRVVDKREPPVSCFHLLVRRALRNSQDQAMIHRDVLVGELLQVLQPRIHLPSPFPEPFEQNAQRSKKVSRALGISPLGLQSLEGRDLSARKRERERGRERET